ncbi:MAG: hypothetical protein HY903_17540 [Deltaproteobacteria bacterium]|nr:hypothetical protein [Deltaproteobacteria bacterium]
MPSVTSKSISDKGYYAVADGDKMDKALLKAIIQSTEGKRANPVSQSEVHKRIAPKLEDGGKLTEVEGNTLLWARRHTKWTPAADLALAKVVQKLKPDAMILAFGGLAKPGDFGRLYDKLETTGRLADLYAVKAEMSSAELSKLWDKGMSLQDLNAKLKAALSPAPLARLKTVFAAWDFDKVLQAMTPADRSRAESGKMSVGEFQNQIYGSWEKEDPTLAGKTPFDPSYKAKFEAIF